jgi:hypothetical protein
VSVIRISYQLSSQTDVQLVHMLIETLYTHCPRKPQKPNSMDERPSM